MPETQDCFLQRENKVIVAVPPFLVVCVQMGNPTILISEFSH